MGGSPPPPNCDQDDDHKSIIVTAQLNQLDGNITFESDSSSSSMIDNESDPSDSSDNFDIEVAADQSIDIICPAVNVIPV